MTEQDYVNVGFTGTQNGMTDEQKTSVEYLLSILAPGYLHHGWCIGADAEADDIARRVGYLIIGHPPIDTSKMAVLPWPHEMYTPRDYLDRDDDIAKLCSVLIAAPSGFKELKRSGTWATVRYARTRKKQLLKVFPDGMIGMEDEKHGYATS